MGAPFGAPNKARMIPSLCMMTNLILVRVAKNRSKRFAQDVLVSGWYVRHVLPITSPVAAFNAASNVVGL